MTDRHLLRRVDIFTICRRPFWLCLPLLLGTAVASPAEDVAVHFDVVPLVVCRDVTTDEFAVANPDERLLEARFEVSTLFVEGRETDLSQYLFRFSSPGQHLRIADYHPKTTLASDYAGNINVEQKEESTRAAGVAVGGVLDHLVKISATGDAGSKDNLALRYELHAPMEPVTASGTIFRGTGVYFKIRPSRQTVFEGARAFSLVFRAPKTWRGDYLQVHCEALGVRRGLVRSLDEAETVGVRDFFVALCLAGDYEAKWLAERMTRTEAVLQKVLASYREVLVRSPKTTVVDQFVALWDGGRAKHGPSPQAHVERLLFSPAAPLAEALPASLPEPVRQALEAYLAARWEVRRLSQ